MVEQSLFLQLHVLSGSQWLSTLNMTKLALFDGRITVNWHC